MNRKYDLNERLIEFAVRIIDLYNRIEKSPAGSYLSDHMMRAGISPSLHYGEAQGAESRRDFIHKFGILLKELRETLNALQIVKRARLYGNSLINFDEAIFECNELIAIFNSSINTAKRNSKK